MGIFGISGIDSCVVEYGCPHAQINFSGKVTDTSTDEAIPGIYVALNNDYFDVTTDFNGNYSLCYQVFSADDITVDLVFSDKDGELNGSYMAKEVSIKIKSSDFIDKNTSLWDNGTANKTINIKLTPDN